MEKRQVREWGIWLGRFVGVLSLLVGATAYGDTVTINTTATGASIKAALRGQCPRLSGSYPTLRYGVLGRSYNTAIRGPAGGLQADTYNWKNRSGCDVGTSVGQEPTLQYLRWGQDHASELVFTVNCRGIDTDGSYDGNWTNTDSSTSTLTTMAADWVKYCNKIVPFYRTDTISTAPAEYQTLVNSLSWGGLDKLLSPSDPAVPTVTWWEIGNEPEVGIAPIYSITSTQYRSIYRDIRSAMRAVDNTIKCGPCFTTAGSIKNANGGFELWTSGVPDNWWCAQATVADNTSQEAHFNRGHKHVVEVSYNGNSYPQIRQDVTVTAGTYRISGWIKKTAGSSGMKGNLVICLRNSPWTAKCTLYGSTTIGEWQFVTGDMTFQAGDENLYTIKCMNDNDQTLVCLYDDVILRSVNSHMDTILADNGVNPTTIDFMSYHPYTSLGSDDSTMKTNLRKMKSDQQCMQECIRADLRKYNRSETLPLLASEYNPANHDSATSIQNSMGSALGIAETLFSYVEMGIEKAMFWGFREAATTFQNWPSYKLYQNLHDYMGDRMLLGYSDGQHFRMYTTKNTTTGHIYIWGFNFSDTTDKSMTIQLTGLSNSYPTSMTYYRLGPLYSDNVTPKDSYPTYNISQGAINWTATDMTGTYLPNFNFTFEDSVVSLLVIIP